MSAHSSIFLLVTLWASMQDGLGVPVLQSLEVEASDTISTHQVRTKRCACSNQLDSECHYFCHLDIIWVNTPSKTTVYGLGGALSRRRRSTDRCTCANLDDQSCASFCRLSPAAKSVEKQESRILSILRAVASRRHQTVDADFAAQWKNAR